jgi:hypothetical protein
MDANLEYVWNKVAGGLDWLKDVLFGEFVDNRPVSAVVADMLVSFVPGVVIVTSARDLTAVIIRMVRDPKKREEVTEWMLVIGCTIPLVLPILAAAAGAAAAGVGAVVGGIGGSEAGAALRGVCLMLIEHGGEILEDLIKFLRRFIKGDILAVLRDINFVKYTDAITKYVGKFIDGMISIIRKLIEELGHLTWFDSAKEIIAKLQKLEHDFYQVQHAAMQHVGPALTELQARLTKALAQESKPLEHLAVPDVHAPKPPKTTPEPLKSPAMPGNPLGHSPELKPPTEDPAAAAKKTNLHPQTTKVSSFPQTLYRVDGRPPGTIFNEGFQPKGTSTDLQTYVDTNQSSGFVSTSKTPDIAQNTDFAQPGKYVYQVDGDQISGIDVNQAYPANPYPHEQEVAVVNGVPSSAVISAKSILPDGTLGNAIMNPNYTGSR